MTENELKILEFEKITADEEENLFYFYIYKITQGLELISCCQDELINHEWYVQIENSNPEIIFNNFGELQGIINTLEKHKL